MTILLSDHPHIFLAVGEVSVCYHSNTCNMHRHSNTLHDCSNSPFFKTAQEKDDKGGTNPHQGVADWQEGGNGGGGAEEWAGRAIVYITDNYPAQTDPALSGTLGEAP